MESPTNSAPFSEEEARRLSTIFDGSTAYGMALDKLIGGLDSEVVDTLQKLWAEVQVRGEKLQALVEISVYLNETLDLPTLLSRILQVTTPLLHAETSSVLLLDETSGELEFLVALGEKGEEVKKVRLKKGEGIAGKVMATGTPLRIGDAQHDPRHSKRSDQRTGFVTRNLLAFPLRTQGRTIGVLEVLNKLPPEEDFNDEDMRVCTLLSNLVAIAIHNARTYARAITDRLTELYNFGYFRERLSAEIARGRERGEPVSLIIFDIDHFKWYNDTHGHEAGNQCLLQVASILRETGRKGEMLARYGGEEFVALLYGATRQEAGRFAEKVRARIEATDFSGGHTQPLGRVTVSGGIGIFPEDAEGEEGLIVAADRNLYRAKESGRNRIITDPWAERRPIDRLNSA